VLRVEDNGRGAVERHSPDGKSFGLLGMRERAHMLGGRVSTGPANGNGFVVTVRFPANTLTQDEVLP
jgi:signal transduction histidine kinase